VRILFTSTHDAAFIKEDLLFLQKFHEVRPLLTVGVSSLASIVAGVLRTDLTFTWFASVYSAPIVFLANCLGKPSIIVVGGVDAAKVPGLKYGVWISKWKSILVRYAVKHADRIIVLSPFLREQLMSLAGYDGKNITVVPTGFDDSFWVPDGSAKERIVLTVAACEELSRMAIKGIPLLIETARELPDIPFVVVGPKGRAAELIRELKPPENMTVHPFLPRVELLSHYQKSQVYCQPSYFEGLGGSICEAMLCECIPVGTRVGGIPSVIGEEGLLVDYGNASHLAEAISRALDSPPEMGQNARARIARIFPLAKREKALVDLVAGVIG
jgi:glycosyltransferase involved in cell wall biosynthesis